MRDRRGGHTSGDEPVTVEDLPVVPATPAQGATGRPTDAERIAALEAENAVLRGEVNHWRGAHRQERHGEWPVGIEQPHPVGSQPRPKPREFFDNPAPWPAGSTIQPAPPARGLCGTCTAKIERGEPAVCGCISGATVLC